MYKRQLQKCSLSWKSWFLTVSEMGVAGIMILFVLDAFQTVQTEDVDKLLGNLKPHK